MRARTIKDCERDIKGIHQWVCIGVGSGGNADVYWCQVCGAVGQLRRDIPFEIHKVIVVRRVQE